MTWLFVLITFAFLWCFWIVLMWTLDLIAKAATSNDGEDAQARKGKVI